MHIITIQLLLLLIGTIITNIVGSSYISYILGSLTVIIPMLLFIFIWRKNSFFSKVKSLPYLVFINLIGSFITLLLLYLLMQQNNLQALFVFIGFFVSCQAYLLAGLVLRKR